MPGMDGFGVLRRMRADDVDAPALFLTARDRLRQCRWRLTLGGDDCHADQAVQSGRGGRPAARHPCAGSGRARTRRRRRPWRLVFADIELGRETPTRCKAGEPVSLSPTEFTAAARFVINAGTVLQQSRRSSTTSGATTSAATSTWSESYRVPPAAQGRYRRTAAACAPARCRLRPAGAPVTWGARLGRWPTLIVPAQRTLPLRVSLVARCCCWSGADAASRRRGDIDPAAQPARAGSTSGAVDASTGGFQQPPELPVGSRTNPARPPSNFAFRASMARRLDGDQRPNRRARRCRQRRRVGPVPVTIGSVGDSNVQWQSLVSVRGPDSESITVAVDL